MASHLIIVLVWRMSLLFRFSPFMTLHTEESLFSTITNCFFHIYSSSNHICPGSCSVTAVPAALNVGEEPEAEEDKAVSTLSTSQWKVLQDLSAVQKVSAICLGLKVCGSDREVQL